MSGVTTFSLTIICITDSNFTSIKTFFFFFFFFAAAVLHDGILNVQ